MPGTFDRWYFQLRLDDEVKRARRGAGGQGSQVSIVVMKVSAPGGYTSPAMMEQINFDVANMAASLAKTMTMPNAIGPLEYGFLLPDTSRAEARSRVAPLLNPLGNYWCEFGIAEYPTDGDEAEELLQIARREIEEQELKSA
jgi:hypothetical protein